MKRALFLDLNHPGNYPFCKDLEKRGFEIINLFRKEPNTFEVSKRLEIFEKHKIMNSNFDDHKVVNKKIEEYFNSKKIINLSNLNLDRQDKIFCFNEELLFESCCLDKTFLSPRKAFALSAKHVYYRQLEINHQKIYSKEQFLDLKPPFVLKPSIASCGKSNVFSINSQEDKYNILQKEPNIFEKKILFLSMPMFKVSTEIWVFTLFDGNYQPHLLWFVTEQGNSTKSPFEEELYNEICRINNTLKIKKWMAFMQFILDDKGKLHFIDLNPRMPGNDDWYELSYRYLTGERLSKIVLDLILDDKIPKVKRTNKYIVEKEYKEEYKDLKNVKIWEQTDFYKNKPVLFFSKNS